MSTFVLLTITGLGLGAMYFLIASGLSLIYGLMGVLNFAHGAFITVGSYATWRIQQELSGVDPIARRQFWDVIRQFSDNGTTVFVSTHYMEEAEYCDRLAFMNRGRVVALGTPSELRGEMTQPILRIDTDDAPKAVPLVAQVPGVLDVSLFGRGMRVVVEDAQRLIPLLHDRLAAAGLGWRAVERIDPSLEDVFVASVNRAGGAMVG